MICVFGLLEWLLFFFSFSPKTLFLSFSSLSSLSVLPIHPCQQHHSHIDWTGGHGNKVSQHIEPLPFSPFTSPLSLLLPSCVHQPVLSTLLHSCFSTMWCVDKHLMPMPFWFHKHTTHTGMDGMGDNNCTALPQHTITTLSLSQQTPTTPTTKTPLLHRTH